MKEDLGEIKFSEKPQVDSSQNIPILKRGLEKPLKRLNQVKKNGKR